MTKVDDALNEVWKATAADPAPVAFSAGVLEGIARRRALREMTIAAPLAFAVFVVAMALGPALGAQAGLLFEILSAPPVLPSLVIIAAGLCLGVMLRRGSVIERGFWSLDLGQ